MEYSCNRTGSSSRSFIERLASTSRQTLCRIANLGFPLGHHTISADGVSASGAFASRLIWLLSQPGPGIHYVVFEDAGAFRVCALAYCEDV